MVFYQRRFVLFAAAAAVTFLNEGTASAQSSTDWERCIGGGGTEVQIAGCTAVIQSPSESKWNVGAAYFMRGGAYNFNGDFDRAIADFDMVLKLGIHISYAADVLNNRGISYNMKGEPDRALADFNEAIKLEPRHSSAFTNRGNVYYQKGQREQAIEDYRIAISFDPDNAEALNNRCLARAELGDMRAALEDCNTSLRLWPGNPEFLDSRGFAFLKLGQLDQAIADYDEVLKQMPQKAYSLYGRGSAKLKKGDRQGGEADIAAATSLNGTIAEEFANRGVPPAAMKPSGQAAAAGIRPPGRKATASRPNVQAGTVQAGTVKELFEKHGLLGSFAADCSKPASQENQYVVHRANGDYVQRDNMTDPTTRSEAFLIETAMERTPNELALGLAAADGRINSIVQIHSGQWRLVESTRENGERLVSDGRMVQGGRGETPWLERCSR